LKLLKYDEDEKNIVIDRASNRRFPGMEPVIDTADWSDTPGSDKIVEILLDDDPRPVYIQAWGGGNTAAYLYSLDNGLRSHEDPTYGGWGGRFYNVYGNVYRDVHKGSYKMWIEFANREFEARMDWCVAEKYEDANHKPVIEIQGNLNRTVRSGEKVALNAVVSDPDGDKTSPLWWQYKEAGTYDEMIKTSDPRKRKITFDAPNVTRPGTIHMIFEVSDRGTPALKAFKRVIIRVLPAS
jgi:hypothetical protein